MKEKKTRKLSVQLIGMTIVLFIIGTVVSAFLLYTGSRDMYLQAKDDMISEKLNDVHSSIDGMICIDWLLPYMLDHNDYTSDLTLEESQKAESLMPNLFLSDTDMTSKTDKLNSFPPEDQRLFAVSEFRVFGNIMIGNLNSSSYKKLYCIDISPENCGFVYCDSLERNLEDDDGYMYESAVTGVKWDYSEKDHPAIKKIREQEKPEIVFEVASVDPDDSDTSYIGYYPIFGGKAAICICYDWAPFRSQLIGKVRALVLVLLAAMLMTCFLIIIFLNKIVVKPLKTVQSAVRGYMEEKDSQKVREKLENVNNFNEIGTLSNDVKDLTVELDSYISNIKTLTVEVMEALAQTIDAKDKYTNGHSIRVAIYSKMIAKQLHLSKEDQENIYYMGLLHDIGKIAIPLEIINKTTRLTDEEYEIIKTHPIKGSEILSEIKSFPELITGARWHHERYDGKGYPDGIAGEDIPFLARIIAVADSYDTMTSNRSYRSFLPQDVVRAEIEKNIGTQFDPAAAKVMLDIIDRDTMYMLHE